MDRPSTPSQFSNKKIFASVWKNRSPSPTDKNPIFYIQRKSFFFEYRGSHPEVYLKISHNSQENTCFVVVSFVNDRAATLEKRDSSAGVFLWILWHFYRPVETGGDWGGLLSPRIRTKVDLLPIDNDSEKKKGAKKHKTYQIPRKLLVTLLLSM